MSEQAAPETTPETPETTQREDVQSLLDKMFQLYADIGKVLEKIASHIESSVSVEQGLIETLGKLDGRIASLETKVEKFAAELKDVFEASKKGKYSEGGEKKPIGGGGEVIEVGSTREYGADMLKTVSTPRAGVEVKKNMISEPREAQLIRDVLAGRLRPFEVGRKLGEVMRA